MNLRQKTETSLKWSSIDQLTTRGIAMVVQLTLARIVGPDEFGLIALTTIFLVLAILVTDAGFSDAIVQRKSIEQIDVSSVFFFNLTISCVLYLALFLSAPWIATFFEAPRLTLILRVLALGLVIGALGKIHTSLLIRNLEFKYMFFVAAPSLIISGIVGISMALNNAGVWALIAQQIIFISCTTITYWLTANSNYRPRFEFCLGSVRRLSSFGFSILGASLLYQGFRHLSGLIIGKFYSPTQLAFYNRADSFQKLPVSTLQAILGRVLFPVFSTIQDDQEKIVRSLRFGIPVLGFVIVPAMFFLILSAHELVETVLGTHWLETAEYLELLPIVGIAYSISAVYLTVWKSVGASKAFFWLTVLRQLFFVSSLAITVQHGVYWIVVGQVASSLIGHSINMVATEKICGYRTVHQIKDLLPCLLASGVACVVTMLLVNYLDPPLVFVSLLAKAFFFGGTYLLICFGFRIPACVHLVERFSPLAPPQFNGMIRKYYLREGSSN